MSLYRVIPLWFVLCIFSWQTYADTDTTSQAVWVNEAIIATYTYNYQNFLERQKEIAVYFTSQGWTAYSKALTDSKLPDTIKKNQYTVSAVAIEPPQVKSLQANTWQAVMPVLVVYKNPQYQQKQTLEITLQFATVPAGQGVRGYAITSLQSVVKTPACECHTNPHETGP